MCIVSAPVGEGGMQRHQSPENPQPRGLISTRKAINKAEWEDCHLRLLFAPIHAHTQGHSWPLFSLPTPTVTSDDPPPSTYKRIQKAGHSSQDSGDVWQKGIEAGDSRFPSKSSASASALHPHEVHRQSPMLSLPFPWGPGSDLERHVLANSGSTCE